jgi:hypothetical protein
MRAPAVLLVLSAMLAPSAPAVEGRVVRLTLPRELREGDSAVLEVTLGRLTTREPIEIRDSKGRLLGAVSTLGVPRGRDAGTYLVPVPNDAFRRGRLSVWLSFGRNRRAPTKDEVRSVKVTIRSDAPQGA